MVRTSEAGGTLILFNVAQSKALHLADSRFDRT